MAHLAPTKSFSRPSPEAAMLPRLKSDITDESLMPSVDCFIG